MNTRRPEVSTQRRAWPSQAGCLDGWAGLGTPLPLHRAGATRQFHTLPLSQPSVPMRSPLSKYCMRQLVPSRAQHMHTHAHTHARSHARIRATFGTALPLSPPQESSLLPWSGERDSDAWACGFAASNLKEKYLRGASRCRNRLSSYTLLPPSQPSDPLWVTPPATACGCLPPGLTLPVHSASGNPRRG